MKMRNIRRVKNVTKKDRIRKSKIREKLEVELLAQHKKTAAKVVWTRDENDRETTHKKILANLEHTEKNKK